MPVAESSSTPNSATPRASFPATLWSMVLAAGSSERSADSDDALTALYLAYWEPLYGFLRRTGKAPADAEDLTQAFFLHLLQRKAFQKVNPERGKFRSFLLASLKNFLVDEWEKSRAQKRGGGAAILSFDVEMAEARYRVEAPGELNPGELFERQWAMLLLERVVRKLEAESAESGKTARFEQLKVFLLGDSGQPGYVQVGATLGMSEGAVKVAVLRLRHRFRDLLRAEIASTVSNDQEVDQELRYLAHLLRSI